MPGVFRAVHATKEEEDVTPREKKPKEPVDDHDEEVDDVAADARDELLWEQLKAEIRRGKKKKS